MEGDFARAREEQRKFDCERSGEDRPVSGAEADAEEFQSRLEALGTPELLVTCPCLVSQLWTGARRGWWLLTAEEDGIQITCDDFAEGSGPLRQLLCLAKDSGVLLVPLH